MRSTGVVLAALAVTLLVATAGTAARPRGDDLCSRGQVSSTAAAFPLSGKVSNSKAGEMVDVLAEPYGATSFSVLGSADHDRRRTLGRRRQADDRNVLRGEVEERDQPDGHGEGAADDHAHAGQSLHWLLLNPSDGRALVRRQVRARAGVELEAGWRRRRR